MKYVHHAQSLSHKKIDVLFIALNKNSVLEII